MPIERYQEGEEHIVKEPLEGNFIIRMLMLPAVASSIANKIQLVFRQVRYIDRDDETSLPGLARRVGTPLSPGPS